MKKRFLAAILALVMVVMLLPTTALAANQLPAPMNYKWDTTTPGKATWMAQFSVGVVVYSYKVQLVKGESYTAIGDSVIVDEEEYDFTSAIEANGSGAYRFTVCAIDGTMQFEDSAVMTSDTYNYTAPVAPAITTQPANQSVVEGNTATFTVAATGNPTPTYQWQSRTSSTGTWANVTGGSGATSASYTTDATTLNMSGYQYRCVASNGVSPDAESDAATLTVTTVGVEFSVDGVKYKVLTDPDGTNPGTAEVIANNYADASYTIPASVSYAGNDYAVTQIGAEAFKNCASLSAITAASVTSIGKMAFYYCTSLTTVSLTAATSIGMNAFYGCSSLTTATFPDATSIGDYAFNDCTKLTTATFPAATSIGPRAFYNCSSLTTATFPDATSIGDYAFNRCTKLTTATFPAATSIGMGAFYYCTSLTTVSLTAATSIGMNAFYGCSSLTTATFPDATSIGDYAFNSCTKLTTATFPAATSIGKNAFQGCSLLDTTSFPAVTSIGDYTFYNCSALATLSLPAAPPTVTNANAFEKCPSARVLTLVNASGAALTGQALNTAIDTYDPDKDGLWYGWNLPARYTPPPAPDPAVIYDENGNPIFIGSFKDALAQAKSGQTVKLNESQTIAENLTVREGVTLDLNGFNIACQMLTIEKGATMIIQEGQTLTIGADGDIKELINNGTIIVYGTLIIDGVAITGEDAIEVYGEIVFKSGSSVGSIRIVEKQVQAAKPKNKKAKTKDVIAPKITIDASFKVSGVTGTLRLPDGWYEVGHVVFDIEHGADTPNFELINAPDKSWYITPEGLLASRAKHAMLIPDYLVIGKNTKVNVVNLLPWKYEGAITWESGDEKVFKIIKDGKKRFIKAVDLGETTLKATFADGDVQIIPLDVVTKKEAVSSVGGPNAIKLKLGETRQLTPKVKPKKAIDLTLFWLSSDDKIATVVNGLITAVGTGTCRVVVVSTSGKRNVTKVTVTKKAAIEDVTLTPVEVTLKAGETYTLTATVSPDDADQALKWSSDKPKIASVKKGVVTAKKPGTATITCKFANGTKLTCEVTVTE